MFYAQLNWAEGVIPTLDEKLTELRAKPTVILSSDGKELYSAQSEYREPIQSLKEVPKHVVDATLAAEDRRFYDHRGIDWVGVGRATVTNVREGRAAQGASTITMQLAKRLYTSPDRSFMRKMKDMALAVQIEQKMPKDEILRLYLNQVFYGAGAYGIGAAAKTYFGKELDELTIGEAALLARVVRRPSHENPFENLEKSIENRDVVLATMRSEGMISQSEYDAAIKETPKLLPKRFASGSHIKRSPYFVNYVLDTLKRELPGVDITEGGYTIETTIDTDLDDFAQKAVRDIVRQYRRQRLTTGAFVVMDDEGKILAMIGGANYDNNEFNVISQGQRQPGSAFKPFVYATAFSMNVIGPRDSISNEPFYLDDPINGRKRWPKNSNGKYGGSLSVRTALASSYNVPAVRVCDMVTPQVAANYARDVFGFQSRIEPVLSMVLGSNAVSPLEMAQGYSVFMNYGDRATPICIKRIIGPNGEVVKEWEPELRRVNVDPRVWGEMDEILRAVVTSGTGRRAQSVPDARGKTGTTSDNRDAWFCGYTNNLVGIGWVASERKVNGRWQYDVMPGVFGGQVTIHMWTAVMKEAVRKFGKKESHRPEDMERIPLAQRDPEPEPPLDEEPPIDDVTGGDPPGPPPDMPPGTGTDPQIDPVTGLPYDQVPPATTETRPPTPTPRTETRPPSTRPEPRNEGPPPAREVMVEICADSGQVATRYCPETVTRRMARENAPRGRCPLHNPGR